MKFGFLDEMMDWLLLIKKVIDSKDKLRFKVPLDVLVEPSIV